MTKVILSGALLLIVLSVGTMALIRPKADDSTLKGGHARDQTQELPTMLEETPAEDQRPRVFYLPHYDTPAEAGTDKWTNL